MESISLFWEVMLPWGHCLVEKKRILHDKTQYLSARMEDIEGENSPTRAQRGKKRKRDDELIHWNDEGQELVGKARCFLSQDGGGWRSFLRSAKMRWDLHRLVDALEVHDKKGDVLLREAMSDAQGPCRGYHIPVKALVSQVASNTLKQLQLLLEDDEVGRIAIHGVVGVGKTFLMKHLYNSALKWVDKFVHVFWVTYPDQFTTIKRLQDVVAAVVKCDLTSDDDLNVRARKLSETLGDLGSFVLFLDGVPGSDFYLDEVGIPVSAEGRKCKVFLTTSSTLECRLLDNFEAIKVDHLPKEQAYQLFMREANIGKELISSLGGISNSLSDKCHGLPCTVVNIATRMRGIDDPREWRNALFELGHFGDE
ncbi:putative disease resistance protein At3g15700 [Beta vulgaris subsp. vulgaris]|uniref:putative disease resistance protein At3g15700 n=1 Tax=Beta vulgaris subsp. vulgaris TaxID=3555 RepID=UPI002036E93D|nr:putative disease resistance protein At3g15700 [Beta vulgaris subsp. vulgaris]